MFEATLTAIACRRSKALSKWFKHARVFRHGPKKTVPHYAVPRMVIATLVAGFYCGSAMADINGVGGPGCVRMWTRALMIDAAPNTVYGMMRQTYANAPPFVKYDDPVDFMAHSCHIDRALASVVVRDEVEASGLSGRWSLPAQSPPQENMMCRFYDAEAVKAAIARGECFPRENPTPAPAAAVDKPPPYLLSWWYTENKKCHEGPQRDAACTIREDYSRQLEALGWCYGKPGQSGEHRAWQKCVSNSLR